MSNWISADRSAMKDPFILGAPRRATFFEKGEIPRESESARGLLSMLSNHSAGLECGTTHLQFQARFLRSMFMCYRLLDLDKPILFIRLSISLYSGEGPT